MPACASAMRPRRSISKVTGRAVNTIELRDALITDDDRIVDRVLLEVRLHQLPTLSVHRNTDGDQPSVLVFLLEFHVAQKSSRTTLPL